MLRRDPVLRLAACLLLAETLPYVLPVLSAPTMATFSQLFFDFPLIIVVAVSFGLCARSSDGLERRFWSLLAAGFGFWLVQQVLHVASGLSGGWTDLRYYVLSDVLYVALYLCLMLGLELAPHKEPDGDIDRSLPGLLPSAGTIVFAFGLLAYFVMIPQALDRRAYESMVPSLTLYLVLDLYLLARLDRLRRAAAGRWRASYACLQAMAALWACTDALELSMHAGLVTRVPEGTPLDLVWLLHYVPALAASRMKAWPEAQTLPEAPRPDVLERLWGGPPVVLAMAFPLVHFLYSTLAGADPYMKPAREICSLLVLLALSAMALAHQRALESENARLEAEQAVAMRQAHHQAYHDPLTGLANRRLLKDRLHRAMAHARRHGGRVAVLFCDLDRFKVINDSLGHVVGDLLLKSVAARMSACLREVDTLARVGGDEFNLVLPDVVQPEDAATVARKLQRALAAPFLLEQHELFVTASIGIAVFPDDTQDEHGLLERADAAMYRAKELGRGSYQFARP